MRFILIFLLTNCCCQYAAGQISESDFKSYFFENIENLEPIEGIYNATLKLDRPSIYSNDCEYKNAIFSNFDKIVIYSKNKRLHVFSINSGLDVGFINVGEFNQILFTSIGSKNFISSDYPQRAYDEKVTLFFRSLNIKDLYELFEYKYAHEYEIRCKNYNKYIEITGAYGVDVELELIKYFPNENEPPPMSSIKTGTGVIISSNGYVITNKHVVQESDKYQWNSYNDRWEKYSSDDCFSPGCLSTEITCILDNKYYKLIPTNLFTGEDLVVLKIENPPIGLRSAIIDTTTPDLGTQLYTLGHPLGMTLGTDIKYTNGYYSSRIRFYNSNLRGISINYKDTSRVQSMYVLNMSLNQGNSGGGVYDIKTNYLIGLATSKLNSNNNLVEGVSFCTELKRLVKITNDTSNYLLTAQVKSIKDIRGIPMEPSWWPNNYDTRKACYSELMLKVKSPDLEFNQPKEINDNKSSTIFIIAK
jgi:S1-C subfamily serine protease